MNFGIVIDEKGRGVMTYEKSTDVRTNVYLSLNMIAESPNNRGSWFFEPAFGLDLSDINQVTTEKVELFQQRLFNALVWLLDAGRVALLTVATEADPTDRNRINAEIEIIQLDQIPMIFSAFVCVGGPSPDFQVT